MCSYNLPSGVVRFVGAFTYFGGGVVCLRFLLGANRWVMCVSCVVCVERCVVYVLFCL